MEREGIVLQIIPQKERDLIAKLLLRDGHSLSIYVYGGMGGGSKAKPRLFEPGSLMRFHLRTQHAHVAGTQSLAVASEYSLVWQPRHIRHSAHGFALACLYLEMMLKATLPSDLSAGAPQSQEQIELFKLLSNGLFHLDEALELKALQWESHLLLFLGKLLLHQGVLPDEEHCVLCGADLCQYALAPLVLEQGGFSCEKCTAPETATGIAVRPLLAQAVRTRFNQWKELPQVSYPVNDQLIRFWCYHFQVRMPELTALKLLR